VLWRSHKPSVRPVDTGLQNECLATIVHRGSATMPPLPAVFKLYAGLRPGIQLKEYVRKRMFSNMGVDAFKFIRLGQVCAVVLVPNPLCQAVARCV
jgi:hypothetical protein